jgi:phage host-nuclease inhibitor protein Gam
LNVPDGNQLVTAHGYQLVNQQSEDAVMSEQDAIEPAAASEPKAEPVAEKKTIEAEPAVSARPGGADDQSRSFTPAIYNAPAQSRRFALLAAALALAAALGGLIGSLSTYGLASPKTDPAEPARNLQAALTQVTKDVAALKTSIEGASRAATNQMTKINERFDRSERVQAEPTAKIAALTETVTRLEKRIAANAEAARDITGSVPDRAAAAATTNAAKDQSKPPIVEGWVLRDIYRGRALVENRSGLYEVTPGADLPGVGKIQTITQQNGRWVVVTPKGLIVR